tara:strand:+ start:2171 stop:2803 length:633 start_codon:yes stop_codon:yes gene_type:complete
VSGESGIIWAASLDARIVQAVVAGSFLAVGWIVNGWQNRRDAARLRAEKLRDYHRALYAEIGTTLANLWGPETLAAQAETLMKQMRADETFVPFIPREHGDHVYNALISEIHILPRRTIDPIVAYYSQIKALAAHADDMRGDGFRNMGQSRRIAMYSDYVEMKEQLLQFGLFATAMIKAYAEGGDAAADQVSARFNTQGADPSGPSQGLV